MTSPHANLLPVSTIPSGARMRVGTFGSPTARSMFNVTGGPTIGESGTMRPRTTPRAATCLRSRVSKPLGVVVGRGSSPCYSAQERRLFVVAKATAHTEGRYGCPITYYSSTNQSEGQSEFKIFWRPRCFFPRAQSVWRFRAAVDVTASLC